MAKKKFPGKSAFVACNGGCDNVSCAYGCIGCGKCVAACRFKAIALNAKGIAEVDLSKCIGCGACARQCPQKIISLCQDANTIRVRCSNHEKGAAARKVCAFSCIACGICEKTCTAAAIEVIDNLATINEEICLSCGMCLVKCPRKVIFDTKGVLV